MPNATPLNSRNMRTLKRQMTIVLLVGAITFNGIDFVQDPALRTLGTLFALLATLLAKFK
jgi:hypothetical protein